MNRRDPAFLDDSSLSVTLAKVRESIASEQERVSQEKRIIHREKPATPQPKATRT